VFLFWGFVGGIFARNSISYYQLFMREKFIEIMRHRSAKSGFASPIRSFVPFHVDPLRRFKPNSMTRTIEIRSY
jgi:hypothetical protein